MSSMCIYTKKLDALIFVIVSKQSKHQYEWDIYNKKSLMGEFFPFLPVKRYGYTPPPPEAQPQLGHEKVYIS